MFQESRIFKDQTRNALFERQSLSPEPQLVSFTASRGSSRSAVRVHGLQTAQGRRGIRAN